MNMFTPSRIKFFSVAAALLFFGVFATFVYANHSWGGYHWARSANPFTVNLGDNVSSAWDSHLATSSSDWSQSSVLDTTVAAGQSNPKNCKAVSGRVEVCSSKYGRTGWLGVASIWVSGGHIVQGAVKLNDTYFNTAKYNTPAWRRFVMCQEIGHTFGLDHQDENFDNPNLGTCMDYTSNPQGPLSNEHPNQHDYDQLEAIYAHFDVAAAFGRAVSSAARSGDDLEGPAQWGKVIRRSSDGRSSLHVRDFGGGHKVFTFVIWAE